MPTDEERMQRSRDTVDEIHETVQRMIEDNKRWNTARDAEREAELVYREKHGGKSKDEVWFKWIVGVPITLFVLSFLVFIRDVAHNHQHTHQSDGRVACPLALINLTHRFCA
ncbi:hypothetical protein A9R05_01225 [Burkholderia sp. KK1]|nr:hypothetical protein A9R05_01225 [Burkholderia sp. KK1]